MAGLSAPDDSLTRPAPLRRAQGHAAWLMVVLIPGASLLSFALAETGGAPTPLTAGMLTLLVALLGALAVLRGLSPDFYPHARLGFCNFVTLTRGAGITVLAGLALAPQALRGPDALGWALVALAAGVLALDLVDGWAARRSGLNSDFGARFDVETDVLFAVVMAVLAWQAGKVGVWFLLLGALRPAFLLALAIWPRLRHPLPDARWRKLVAAVQMTGQVALLAPVLAPSVSHALGAAILLGVAFSFAVDLRWLVRQPTGPKV